MGNSTITLEPDWRSALGSAGKRARETTYRGEALTFESAGAFFGKLTARRWALISYDGKPAMFSFCRDITEQRAARERIEYLAFHDSLTDPPNRLLAQDYLTKAVAIAQRRQSRLAVLEVDIHRLGEVNDTYGWDMADLLPRRKAQRLTLHLRAEETLARLSSDEFLIIMSNIEAGFVISQIAALCERLLGILAQPFDLEGWQVEVNTPRSAWRCIRGMG